jgi:GNAT superfamily N-acetyltransferase
MPHYVIGPARPGDLLRLPLIEVAAAQRLRGYAPDSVLGETSSLADLQLAQREGRLWVARADAVAVGFAHVHVLDQRTAHLEELDVLSEHGRRGLGTRLVEEVCRWAGLAGFERVTLTTFRDVPFNRPFYERLGFRVIPMAELPLALRLVVQEETRRGLDPSRRVVMTRPCGRGSSPAS